MIKPGPRTISENPSLTLACATAHTWITMARTSNRKPSRKSQPNALNRHIPFTSPELRRPKLVAETLLECIRTGDLDAFRDVLTSHLMTANKMQLAKKSGLGRRTLYDIIDRKKKFNPELSTVSAIIRGLAS